MAALQRVDVLPDQQQQTVAAIEVAAVERRIWGVWVKPGHVTACTSASSVGAQLGCRPQDGSEGSTARWVATKRSAPGGPPEGRLGGLSPQYERHWVPSERNSTSLAPSTMVAPATRALGPEQEMQLQNQVAATEIAGIPFALMMRNGR